MGSGKSKVIERKLLYVNGFASEDIIDPTTGEVVRDKGSISVSVIDFDEDAFYARIIPYEKSILNYNLSAEELQNIINNSTQSVVYGWDLITDTQEVDLSLDGRDLLFISDDLSFFVYEAVTTADKIQVAYQDITGDTTPLNRSVSFRHSSEDYLLKNASGYNFESKTTDYYGEIVLNVDDLLEKNNFSLEKDGSIAYNRFNDAMIMERDSATSGLISASGYYSKSTIAHEMGHSVYWSLISNNDSKISFDLWFMKNWDFPISAYAQRSVQEAFSECFSNYVLDVDSNSAMYTEFEKIMEELNLTGLKGCAK